MAYDGATGLNSVTFVIEGEINTEFTLTELADGTLQIDVAIVDSELVGDLRGVFFDVLSGCLVEGMTIWGDDVTAYVTDEDGVKKVSNSVNINGEVLNSYGKFDVGIEFGTNGLANDDIQSTTFYISHDDYPITIDQFEASDFALRYTSVGEEGGSRDGSLKIGGESEMLGSIGDYVWLDADMDGVQDAEELGIEGVEIALYKNGVDSGLRAVTDASGYYLFDMLEAADYQIVVTAFPENHAFTMQGVGDDALDSDVDAAGVSAVFTLAEGEDRADIDVGLYDLGSVVVDPVLEDDAAGTCWTDARVIDVLANDEAGVTITAINGTAVAAGDTVALASGATVTLNADGTLTYDVLEAWYGLDFGTMGADAFTYTAENADGGSADAAVSMMICADNIRTIEDLPNLLPDTVTLHVTEPDSSYFDVAVTSPEAPRFDASGLGIGYCVDIDGFLPLGVDVTAEVFIADETDASLAPYVANYENLDLVTWILNQDWLGQGYTAQNVQDAIWNLTDDYFILFDFAATTIVNEALANGEGFVAGEGEKVGILLAPLEAEGEDLQTFIYAADYDSFAECLCM